jgi:hypothetical protein
MPSRHSLPPDAHIAFLHTSPVHVATFDRLLDEHLPGMRATHVVDVSLLDEVRRDDPTNALRARLGTHLDRLAEASPALIICTCSSIGPLAEAHRGMVWTIRLDRPMAETAVRIATAGTGRIGVAAALESTVHPTTALLHEVASAAGADVVLTVIPCFDACGAFEAGDYPGYATRIAEAIHRTATDCDVIVLAQASMAVALPLLDLPVPVLTSPRALIESLASSSAEPMERIRGILTPDH